MSLRMATKTTRGAELRHSVIASIQKSPISPVAEGRDFSRDVATIILENGIENTAHIFNHHGAGADFSDKSDSFWKQVSLVGITELLSRDRKRRAG